MQTIKNQTLLLLSEGQRTIPHFAYLFPKPAVEAKAIAVTTAATLYDSYREKEWFVRERGAFETLGIHLEDLDLNGKNPSEVAAALDSVDIIYVNGGNTYFLMEKINQSGFAEILKERLRNGALYIGSSAGTIVACPDISYIEKMDEPEAANLTDFTGMGLINFSIMPHIDHPSYGEIARAIAAKATPDQRMIGLRDEQAIVVRGSMWRFIKARSANGLTPAERRIVRLVSAIQFLTILDFQMVMPLGADFARDLDMAASNIGWVTGAYTAAAFLSGIVGARFLNRIDRRLAMSISLWGLVIATALGGLAINYATLIAARVLAGLFSGPAVSLSYALLTDQVPEERRGRAIGMVGSVWSLAGIIGLPIGLKLAEWGSWRTPFFIIALMGIVLIPLLMRIVKRTMANRENEPLRQLQQMIHQGKKAIVIAFLVNLVSVGANFLLVPNVAAYLQLNLGYPRDQLSFLYFLGGFITFFTLRLVGRLIDRFGTTYLITAVTLGVVVIYYSLYIGYRPWLSITLLFVLSGIFNSGRYTVVSTETSKVPSPDKRAGFMSLMSSAQALGQSLGAFISSLILFQATPDQPLEHMAILGYASSVLALIVPMLLFWLARLNKRRMAGFAPLPEPLI